MALLPPGVMSARRWIASSSSSCRPTPSTRCATRSSRRARVGSASTSAAPGTRRGPGRSGLCPARALRSARSGAEERVPGAPSRDRLPGAGAGEGDRRPSQCAPVRGAGVRRLRARVKVVLYTDGGARGNPGPAAFGVRARGRRRHDPRRGRRADRRGDQQRRRVPRPGRRARARLELGVPEVEVRSDSELLVKQMRGEYRVKNDALRTLSLEAARLARTHRPRRVRPRSPRAATSLPTAS